MQTQGLLFCCFVRASDLQVRSFCNYGQLNDLPFLEKRQHLDRRNEIDILLLQIATYNNIPVTVSVEPPPSLLEVWSFAAKNRFLYDIPIQPGSENYYHNKDAKS